jgi:hypothetical protein
LQNHEKTAKKICGLETNNLNEKFRILHEERTVQTRRLRLGGHASSDGTTVMTKVLEIDHLKHRI